MTSSLQSVADDILVKLSRIEERHRALERRCRELEEANADLQYQLRQTQSELEQSRRDAEFLTLSHRLAESPAALVQARKIIASMIRRVDKAISLAGDDLSL